MATAVVSLPPRPSVVTSPSGVTPWKPATTTTRSRSRCARARVGSILRMRASLNSSLVRIPACAPVSAMAGQPARTRVWARTAVEMISPVDNSRSSVRGSMSLPISRINPISVSVA